MASDKPNEIMGWIVIGLVVWGGYAGISHILDKGKSDPSVSASAPDPRDQKIKELSDKVAALESKPKQHHYELRKEGVRTWRFDSDTGDTCIQLTTKDDWKRPQTTRQGCQYTDFLAEHADDPKAYNEAECWLVGNKKACDWLTAN
jgi:hypothetical protein